jgi:hypothetical protein
MQVQRGGVFILHCLLVSGRLQDIEQRLRAGKVNAAHLVPHLRLRVGNLLQDDIVERGIAPNLLQLLRENLLVRRQQRPRIVLVVPELAVLDQIEWIAAQLIAQQ